MQLFLNHKIYLILVFLLALGLRLYGLNWDQGQHLNPDERFLTMVGTTVKPPTSLSQYFSTTTSPLNPYNYQDYQFFVYGTFPLFVTKFFAVIFNIDNYTQFTLLGRFLSAIFDSVNIFWLYLLAIKTKLKIPLLPSLLYALLILPIQQSHFFIVDTFLASFILLTFTLLVFRRSLPAALTFGAALACKITAIYFFPIILLFLIFHYRQNIFLLLRITFYLLLITFLIFRLFQPYAFTSFFQPNPHFIANLKTLSSFNNPSALYPPSIQWLSQVKYIFPLKNIIFWGIGLPLTLFTLLSLLRFRPKNTPPIIVLSAIWILILFVYQSSQFTYTMRYYLPIYPFICLVTAYLVSNFSCQIITISLIFHGLWALMFISIYSRPHSRVQASNWIYQYIPANSTIANEYWDDPLPLYLPNKDPNIYHGSMLPLYDPDTPDKWQKLNATFTTTDYLFLSSNRLWGSISRVPQKYPTTSRFYTNLFSQNLGFTRLKTLSSYPGFSLPFLKSCYYFGPTNYPAANSWLTVDNHCFYPGLYLRDDTAEEAFTVYDHPQVIIFQRTAAYTPVQTN